MGKFNHNFESLRQTNKEVWQSAQLNDQQYVFYYNMLSEMAIAVNKWINLPPEINVRWLELNLLNNGLATFFHDKDYDKYFALKSAPSGRINMLNEPTAFYVYGGQGYHKHLKAYQSIKKVGALESVGECVPIWANYMRVPPIIGLLTFARKLANIDRTTDINLHAQKTPIIVKCEQSAQLTVKNALKQYSGNEPVLVVPINSTLGEDVSYLSPNAPYLADKLQTTKSHIWNEAMSFLGISNAVMGKKERMIVDEVNANNGQVSANRLSGLECRRIACDQINELYGLNVSVEFNSDLETRLYDGLTLAPLDGVNIDVED